MPSGKKPTSKKPMSRRRRGQKAPKKRRGPVMRFKFSRLILLCILSLILNFGAYLYNRNVHPEKDVFVKPSQTESSSKDDSIPEESSVAEAPTDDSSVAESSQAPESSQPEESSAPAAPKKVNPVPDMPPQPSEYLTKCAFLGETNIFNMGKEGLLKPYCYYASETLTLENYTKEYVMLEGTTIRILSAINSSNCPIYLMFGTESLGKQPADQTADQFASLLNSVIATAPEATVYVLAIPPVTAAAEKAKENPILNATIDEYNSMLLELCNQTNVYFVDTNTPLKNNEGRLSSDMALEDGRHLTVDSLTLILSYILSHVPAV